MMIELGRSTTKLHKAKMEFDMSMMVAGMVMMELGMMKVMTTNLFRMVLDELLDVR